MHSMVRTTLMRRLQQRSSSFLLVPPQAAAARAVGPLPRTFSTYRYAVVNHAEEYQASMEGRHGKQLALAALEGIGKDDPPFDPFLEDEEEDLLEDDGDDEGEEEIEGSEGEAFEDYDDDEEEEDYSFLDSKRSKAELATLRAGAPGGGLFAVLELAGSQYKVSLDDVLIVNRLDVKQYPVGSVHLMGNVMLVGSQHQTLVGMPFVKAQVQVRIEEHTQDAKVIVFKKRRRKNSRRRNGFRREVTFLRIMDIMTAGV